MRLLTPVIKMRLIWLVITVVFISVSSHAQSTAFPNQFLEFSQPTSDVQFLTKFEVKYDNGSYIDIGLPGNSTLSGTFTVYKTPIAALTPGTHVVTVRACNQFGCSADAQPLTFTMIVISTPTGLRIVQ